MYGRRLLALSLLGLASCLPAPVTLDDIGLACASQEEAGALQIEVTFDACGSACDEVLEASCSATVEEGVVRVSSTLRLQPPRPGTACTLQCVQHATSCELTGLPAGSYTLEYNEQSAPLLIPEVGATTCAGEAP